MADLALKAMTDEPNKEDFARVKAITDAEFESFRALVQFGQGALRTSLLINGGATVALLSFFAATVSSVAAYSEHLKQALLTYGLVFFSVPLLLALVMLKPIPITMIMTNNQKFIFEFVFLWFS